MMENEIRNLKIAICDDKENVLTIIRAAVENIFSKHAMGIQVETWTSVKEMWKQFKEENYDLVFLDINMPVLDGIQFGRKLKTLSNPPDIIFCSSKTDRVFETFELQPFGFVRKDNFIDDMTSVINRYISTKVFINETEDTVAVKSNNMKVLLNLNHVKYIESQNNGQIIHLRNGETMKIYLRLSELEEVLKGRSFLRIHKSYLCNPRYVKRFEGANLILATGEALPIGRSKKAEAEQRWMEYVREHGISFIG